MTNKISTLQAWRERHPRLHEFVTLLLVGLVIGGLLFTIRGGRHFVPNMTYSLLISLAIGYSIGWLQRGIAALLLRRHPNDPRLCAGWPGWPWMSACIVVGSLAGYLAGTALGDWLLNIRTPALWDTSLTRALVTLGFLFGISVLVTLFFFARERLQQLQIEQAQAQRLAAEAQLRALQSQLEPHMLFNTLAHLRVLIKLRPDDAQAMLDELIAYLRATLQGSRQQPHPLGKEFERLQDYLKLMQRRMGARLQVELQLPAELAALQVPPLLLQPLVENAIQHGLEPHVDGGRLQISAAREGDALLLVVSDNGAGLGSGASSAGTGFGTQQVRERLATQYGGAAAFSLEALSPHGCLARIRLPLESPT